MAKKKIFKEKISVEEMKQRMLAEGRTVINKVTLGAFAQEQGFKPFSMTVMAYVKGEIV